MKNANDIRVLHIIDTLGRGGAETLLRDSCRFASEHGIDAHVIATGGGDLESDFQKSGIHFLRRDRNKALDTSIIRFIREYCQHNNIEVVHGHQPVSTLHALRATTSLGIPLVHSIHGFTEDLKNRLVFRYITSRVNANVLVSSSMQTMLMQKEWIRSLPNAHVVYNGVDESRLQIQNSSLRQELHLSSNTLLIGMVGNFYCVKDQITVCKAMKHIVAHNPHVHCVFAGRPDDRVLFEDCVAHVKASGVEDNVHFLGGRADIANVLHSLDLFVFSTLKDTFGLALIEAMLVGVASVASDIDVMREVSENGQFARLFRTSDEHDLAKQILTLMLNSEQRQRLARNGNEYAKRRFSIGSHLQSIREVYKNLIPSPPFKEMARESRYIQYSEI